MDVDCPARVWGGRGMIWGWDKIFVLVIVAQLIWTCCWYMRLYPAGAHCSTTPALFVIDGGSRGPTHVVVGWDAMLLMGGAGRRH